MRMEKPGCSMQPGLLGVMDCSLDIFFGNDAVEDGGYLIVGSLGQQRHGHGSHKTQQEAGMIS